MNKKLIALVLAFALVVSSFSAAFADTAIPADAQVAKDLGMLVGSGNGVTPEYLNENPTRIQSAIMFLRLKGLYETAASFNGTANFADAKDMKWAEGKNILAYLKAHPELGFIGTGANVFNANDKIDAQSYYKVMLEAIGYKQNTTEVIGDFTWNNVFTFAASKGLTKVANVQNFVVSDIATATIEALKATVNGSTKTLAVSLVDAKVIDMVKAIAAGLYVAPADKTAPTVASVTMTNLKQAVIVFSEVVDKTTAQAATSYGSVGTAVLGADGKTVTLTLTNAVATNGADVEFAVKDVKDAAGNVMTAATVTAKAFDVTIPVAQKIEVTGPQQFKITFNEPINTAVAGSVLVENGIYGATVSAISGNTVTVDLGSTLAGGSYKVKVAGYKDYAGFQIAATDMTLVYAKDEAAVTATVKEATQTYVIVEFNKAVKGTLTAANFYHTFPAWAPTSVKDTNNVDLDANKFYTQVKINFPATGFPIPAGTTKLVVLKTVGAVDVADQWGNKMTSDATLSITVTADAVAPTVTKVEATAENTVVVTFSEDIAADVNTGANNAANYVVKDSTGKVVTGVTPVYSNTNSVYKTTLTIAPALAGGNYTVEVKDVTDKALAANKLATVTNTFSVTDKTAPHVHSAVVVENTTDTNVEYVYITFNETMATTGVGSILDIKNYQLNGAAMPEGSKVELFGTATKVKLTVPAQTASLVGATKLTIGQLADVSGNKIVALATAVTIAEDVAPVVTSVKTIALNKIEIVVNGILSAVSADGIKVDGKDADAITSTLAAVSFVVDEKANTTTITGTLVANENIADGASKVAVVEIVGEKVKTITGKFMAANADVFAGVDAATNNDGIAPAFKAIADGTVANTFTVQFDENLVQIVDGLTATEFVVVDKDGKTLVANVDYTTTVADDTVTFTFAKAYTGKVTVSTKATVTYFGDNANGTAGFQPASDNAAKAFSGKEVTIQ